MQPENLNENRVLNLTVPEQFAGMRLDQCLAQLHQESSRSRLQSLIKKGFVKLNEAICDSPKSSVAANDRIALFLPPEPEAFSAKAEQIDLDIMYEDEFMLVVNKPAGMVVHPGAGNWSGTLVNALLGHDPELAEDFGDADPARPGIVHRIDKDTSGLLIVAKNDFSHTRLAEQIQAHTFTREYSAVVYGSFKEDSGTVDQPLGRHPTDRKKIAVLPNSPSARRAVTHFWVVKRFQGFTQLRLRLETGRTHQIRVHMAYLGHPVAGDPVYGPKKSITSLEGQCLHAGKIGFVHPRTGEYLEITSELPSYFTAFLEKLKKQTFGGMECGLERDSSGE